MANNIKFLIISIIIVFIIGTGFMYQNYKKNQEKEIIIDNDIHDYLADEIVKYGTWKYLDNIFDKNESSYGIAEGNSLLLLYHNEYPENITKMSWYVHDDCGKKDYDIPLDQKYLKVYVWDNVTHWAYGDSDNSEREIRDCESNKIYGQHVIWKNN